MNQDPPEDVETETRNRREYPSPDGWTLSTVEADTVLWRSDRDGEDHQAILVNEWNDGNPKHVLSIDGEQVLEHQGGGGWSDDGLWTRVYDELASHGGAD